MVESRRYGDGKVAQRHVLYLGEINDSQRLAWERAITVFDESTGMTEHMALFPVDRLPPAGGPAAVQVRLDSLRLERPRQWGACWLGAELWRTLHLDDFFGARLPLNREGTDWEKVLRILAIYRLLSPGSEWRLHRQWAGSCRSLARRPLELSARPGGAARGASARRSLSVTNQPPRRRSRSDLALLHAAGFCRGSLPHTQE